MLFWMKMNVTPKIEEDTISGSVCSYLHATDIMSYDETKKNENDGYDFC